MTKTPWVRFWPSDWLSGTAGLTAAERGAYITLLALMFDYDGPIKRDDDRLSRRCGMPKASFRRVLDNLIGDGKIVSSDGMLTNGRAEIEMEGRRERSQHGSRANEARWSSLRQKTVENQGSFDPRGVPGESPGIDGQEIDVSSSSHASLGQKNVEYQGQSDPRGVPGESPGSPRAKGPQDRTEGHRPGIDCANNVRVRQPHALSLDQKTKENQGSFDPRGVPGQSYSDPEGQKEDSSRKDRTENSLGASTPKSGTAGKAREGASAPDGFEVFWSSYPHRGGNKRKRRPAEVSYTKAVNAGVSPSVIIAGARAFHADPDVQRGYAPDAVTWLNQGRWIEQPKGQEISPNGGKVYRGPKPAKPEYGDVWVSPKGGVMEYTGAGWLKDRYLEDRYGEKRG
jgi:uncharacterized protein YdaU (DUF1376 family)